MRQHKRNCSLLIMITSRGHQFRNPKGWRWIKDIILCFTNLHIHNYNLSIIPSVGSTMRLGSFPLVIISTGLVYKSPTNRGGMLATGKPWQPPQPRSGDGLPTSLPGPCWEGSCQTSAPIAQLHLLPLLFQSCHHPPAGSSQHRLNPTSPQLQGGCSRHYISQPRPSLRLCHP